MTPRIFALSLGLLCAIWIGSIPAIARSQQEWLLEEWRILAQNPPPISLELRAPRTRLFIGDPIPVDFVITNRGTTDYAYFDLNYDRSGRMDEFHLTATLLSSTENPREETASDPRQAFIAGFGGGIGSFARLAPGLSFEQTIDLNRWALIRKPGRYRVTGNYGAIPAPPFEITVESRSEDEMAVYIDGLAARMKALHQNGSAEREDLVMKLMYTGNTRIVPTLIDSLFSEDFRNRFWEIEAFLCYLPRSQEIKASLLTAAMNRGLMSQEIVLFFQSYQVSAADMFPVVVKSLASEKAEIRGAAVFAAQRYPNDAFTSRLIEMATTSNDPNRGAAVAALAINRTNESVQALRTLLTDPDETIRKTATRGIRNAYLYRPAGRPFRADDFDEILQKPDAPADRK